MGGAGTGETQSAPSRASGELRSAMDADLQQERVLSVRHRLQRMLSARDDGSSGTDSEIWSNRMTSEKPAASRPSTTRETQVKRQQPRAIPADVHEEVEAAGVKDARSNKVKPATKRQSAETAKAASPWEQEDRPAGHHLVGKDVAARIGMRVAVADARLARFVDPTGTIIETRCAGQRVRVEHDGEEASLRYYNTGKDGEFQLLSIDKNAEDWMPRKGPSAGSLQFTPAASPTSSTASSAAVWRSDRQKRQSSDKPTDGPWALPEPPAPVAGPHQDMPPSTPSRGSHVETTASSGRRSRYAEARRSRIGQEEQDDLLTTTASMPAARRYSQMRRSASMPQDAMGWTEKPEQTAPSPSSATQRPNPLLGGSRSPARTPASPSAANTPRRYSELRRERVSMTTTEEWPKESFVSSEQPSTSRPQLAAQAKAAARRPESRRCDSRGTEESAAEAAPRAIEPKARQERPSSGLSADGYLDGTQGKQRLQQLEDECRELATKMRSWEQGLSKDMAALREEMQSKMKEDEERMLARVNAEVSKALFETLGRSLAKATLPDELVPSAKSGLGKSKLLNLFNDAEEEEEEPDWRHARSMPKSKHPERAVAQGRLVRESQWQDPRGGGHDGQLNPAGAADLQPQQELLPQPSRAQGPRAAGDPSEAPPLEKARLDAEMARLADLRRFASGVLGLVGGETPSLNVAQPPVGDLYPAPFPQQHLQSEATQLMAQHRHTLPVPAAQAQDWQGAEHRRGSSPAPAAASRGTQGQDFLHTPNTMAKPPPQAREESRRGSAWNRGLDAPDPGYGVNVAGSSRCGMPDTGAPAVTMEARSRSNVPYPDRGSVNVEGVQTARQAQPPPPPAPWEGQYGGGWEDHADREGRLIF